MKAKNLLLKAIFQEGVNHVFMVPGGLVDPFLTAFQSDKKVRPIVAAQEGGAAFMADGYARASGLFGVCLCIGGPGLTNTTTPILTAKSDHIPLLVISGEVPTSLEGVGDFQDASQAGLDDFSILKSVVKSSINIENPCLMHHHLRRIMIEMLGPVRHPVHLCLPVDIQEAEVDDDFRPLDGEYYRSPVLDTVTAAKCLNDFKETKIAILAGDGIESYEGSISLVAFSEKYSIPVATTLRAKGVFPEDHPLSLGVFGYSGTNQATQAFLDPELDVLVVLGSGLNVRDSLHWTHDLNPRKSVIQVNIDYNAFSSLYPQSKLVFGDCKVFLEYISALLEPAANLARDAWVKSILSQFRLYDVENTLSDAVPLHPARVIHDLRKAAPRDTVLLVDSGAHRAFCGHYWEAYEPLHYLSATNLGPMGWAIPASIGAKLARPELPCCVVTGDGCMLMHGMEIHTASKYDIPVVFVVINNGALGNVYLRAKKEGEVPVQLTSLPDRDWAMFARALGLQAATVDDPSQLETVFKQAFQSGKPFLIDVKCDKNCPTPVEPYAKEAKLYSYHE